MPSILDAGFNQRFHLNRYTDVIYKGAVGNISVQVDPFEEARLQVTLDSAQTGSLRLVGSSTETLTYANIEGQISSNYFTTISSVDSVSGLSGNMTIKAMIGQGSPVKNLLFQTSFRGFMFPIDESYKLENQGYDKSWQAILYCSSDVDIQRMDRITDEGNPDSPEYEVVEKITSSLRGSSDHYKIILR